jgi:hypothetical protein
LVAGKRNGNGVISGKGLLPHRKRVFSQHSRPIFRRAETENLLRRQLPKKLREAVHGHKKIGLDRLIPMGEADFKEFQ